MNRKIYYAHSGNKADKSDWQLLSDHLSEVARIARCNASYFDAEVLAKVTGLLHDVGKYSEAFQKRLEGGKRVDHATAGAKISEDMWGPIGKLLAYIIAGHHAGLANGIDEGAGRSTLTERLARKSHELNRSWKDEIEIPDLLSFPEKFKLEKNLQGFQLAFLTRMLFSCLIDADRLDTEAFYLKLEGKQSSRGSDHSLIELRDSLKGHLNNLHTNSSASDVNKLRREVLDHSIKKAILEPGLFTLTVPTGGGKTLTSMAFALEHAIRYQEAHKFRRIIYVIPFTSIIEQNAKVFRDIFAGLGEDIVIEHHSAYDADNFKYGDDTKDKLRLAMENWDAPVVVTTAVQFFESLFADKTSRCRKLHNISGSVIILDEAQMLPLSLLRPTMAAIDELARNYHCSIVLCTATQPALRAIDGFINGFEIDCDREIAPYPEKLFARPEVDRVKVRHIGVQEDEQLVERMVQHKQILIIVNNRRHARSLFDSTSGDAGYYHLTTLMCAKHRRIVLEEIRNKLANKENCKVISTSLIEAGVDISFPLVMRAETGLDSVMQAAGRCNREGLAKKEDSEVLVFTSPQWKAPPELEQYAASMRQVVRNHEGDLLSPEAISAYFSDVYWRKGDGLDAKKLLKTHRDHCEKLSFSFQDIAKEYRIIESEMRAIIIPYDEEAERCIDGLRHSEFVGAAARKLQPYLVQVPEWVFKTLDTANAIVPIQRERFGDQFWELINDSLYCKSSGLNFDDPCFIEGEKLVW